MTCNEPQAGHDLLTDLKFPISPSDSTSDVATLFPVAPQESHVSCILRDKIHPWACLTAPPSPSHRVVAAELHGAAGDHHGDELPAHGAVREQLPGPLGLQAFGFSLLLQNLVELAALDGAALQASQSSRTNDTEVTCNHDDHLTGPF